MAEILVLDESVTIDEARDMLWRRERRKVGTDETYAEGDSENSVLVRTVTHDACVANVHYTDFHDAGKLAEPTAADLAKRAIESVPKAEPEMDGITYLMRAMASGIETELTKDSRDEILKQTDTDSLTEARDWARTMNLSIAPRSQQC